MQQAMQELNIKITGVSPILMHKDTLLNPRHPLSRQMKTLTSQRKKSDEVIEEIAKIEWRAALYWDDTIGCYIPGEMIERTIINGGKLQKLGKQLERTMRVLDNIIPLDYPNKKKPEQLYESLEHVDIRAVRVQTSGVMRCRPVFSEWSAQFKVIYNPEHMDAKPLIKAIEDAGQLIGIMDYRPRFGKFSVEVLNGKA